MLPKILKLQYKIGILGQVWYLIVSTPDLCTLTYFDVNFYLFSKRGSMNFCQEGSRPVGQKTAWSRLFFF